jgi:23S rRNA (uracil1939-C5)-methyltransferase
MPPAPPNRCPHRPPCGGCALLELPYEAQRERKRSRVCEALARFPSQADLPVGACLPAPSPVGYRTRAKFAVALSRGAARAVIGLFRPGSHEVLDLPECRVVHPALLPLLDELRARLPEAGLPVLHVDLRWSRHAARAHLTLVVRGPCDPDRARPFAAALCAVRPELAGVGLRETSGGPVPRAVGGSTRDLCGERYLVETLAGARFRLSPGAFFQADPAAAEQLHRLAREWLGDPAPEPPRQLCDLYAGVGAFAVTLADLAPRVTAVEQVAAAAEDAVASAALSGAALQVVRAPVERFLAATRDDPPDRVVLDPPRRGLAAAVIQALGAAGPTRLAYVSCDPETLARDLDALAPLGLVAREAVPVDLFAQTDEVETVALLERSRAPWRPTTAWSGNDALAAVKPAILPTHPQAPGDRSLLAAARAAEERDDLQAVHRLDVGTSGPVLLARGEALRRLGRAFETGAVHKEYLALVKGVPRRSGRIRVRGERGAEEETRYRLERVVGGYGLLRVLPTTGRRHQIRRHLARLGHPVLGDERHGDPRANRFLAETCALTRPFLHLALLAFADDDDTPVRLEQPLPPELELVLARLTALRAADAALPELPDAW